MIALVADSHGAVDRLEKVLECCSKNKWPMAHAGDGVVEGLPELFAKFPDVKIWWALGNNDMNQELIAEISALPNIHCEEIISFEYEGQKIAISHYEGVAEKTLNKQKIDVWLHGHTHRAKATRNTDGSVVVNPGALFEDGKYILWNPKKGTGERVFFNY